MDTPPPSPAEPQTHATPSPSVTSDFMDALADLTSELAEPPLTFQEALEGTEDACREAEAEGAAAEVPLSGGGGEGPMHDYYDALDRRKPIRQALVAQLTTPRRILLLDKLTFTASLVDLVLSAFWLGASPQTFYRLFTVKAVVLVALRWANYRAKRWHYYLLVGWVGGRGDGFMVCMLFLVNFWGQMDTALHCVFHAGFLLLRPSTPTHLPLLCFPCRISAITPKYSNSFISGYTRTPSRLPRSVWAAYVCETTAKFNLVF
jgi:hypothetical protein